MWWYQEKPCAGAPSALYGIMQGKCCSALSWAGQAHHLHNKLHAPFPACWDCLSFLCPESGAFLTRLTPDALPQEEFLSAYAEQLGVVSRQAELQKQLEESSDDMDR